MKIRKKVVTGMMLIMVGIIVEHTDVLAVSRYVRPVNDVGVETFSADTKWYYKVENGKTYKRLYDLVDGKWLTDWILVS